MAVFLLNECKFNNCGLCFKNLYDLIQHIEDNHIGKKTKPFSSRSSVDAANVFLGRRPFYYIFRFDARFPFPPDSPTVAVTFPYLGPHLRRWFTCVTQLCIDLNLDPTPPF